jgi:hypothetical protein
VEVLEELEAIQNQLEEEVQEVIVHLLNQLHLQQ